MRTGITQRAKIVWILLNRTSGADGSSTVVHYEIFFWSTVAVVPISPQTLPPCPPRPCSPWPHPSRPWTSPNTFSSTTTCHTHTRLLTGTTSQRVVFFIAAMVIMATLRWWSTQLLSRPQLIPWRWLFAVSFSARIIWLSSNSRWMFTTTISSEFLNIIWKRPTKWVVSSLLSSPVMSSVAAFPKAWFTSHTTSCTWITVSWYNVFL